MFRDEITIEVLAGKGGDGIVSFHREKFVPKGGPDGGDGGRGGNVVLIASPQVNSLLKLGRQQIYRATHGQPGGNQRKSGRDGADLELEVPLGTQVFDAERGNLLRDLTAAGQRLEVALGGAGGKGNVHFANASRQTPRIATLGEPGERRKLRLELKLFAELGLVGLPNAGKSTLLSKVTAATPKIADYPFTTLAPQVAVAQVGEDTLCLADLPGLIEGASEGHGLGHRFLKHVERCQALAQLVDVSSAATVEPEEAWRIVDRELERSSPELFAKPRLILATKCESEDSEERADRLESAVGRPLLRISSLTGRGLDEMLRAALRLVRAPAGR
jgi:GTPase